MECLHKGYDREILKLNLVFHHRHLFFRPCVNTVSGFVLTPKDRRVWEDDRLDWHADTVFCYAALALAPFLFAFSFVLRGYVDGRQVFRSYNA